MNAPQSSHPRIPPQQERDLLHTLIHNLPDLIYVKNAEFWCVISNTGHFVYFEGNKSENILGKTNLDLFLEELATQCYPDKQARIWPGQSIINKQEIIINQTTNQPLDVDRLFSMLRVWLYQ